MKNYRSKYRMPSKARPSFITTGSKNVPTTAVDFKQELRKFTSALFCRNGSLKEYLLLVREVDKESERVHKQESERVSVCVSGRISEFCALVRECE